MFQSGRGTARLLYPFNIDATSTALSISARVVTVLGAVGDSVLTLLYMQGRRSPHALDMIRHALATYAGDLGRR